jgi:hypothetical protein
MPRQLAVADGSLWASTRLRGSLARYGDGRCEVFRRETFGTEASSPRHEFAVAGSHLWAAIDDRLVHFDGRQWQSLTIPNAAADHIVAADQGATWVLGNDGILRTWSAERWETFDLRPTVVEAAWDSDKAFFAPRLVAAGDGSLWLCAKSVWRGHGGAWSPVRPANEPLGDVEFVGQADGKLWFDGENRLTWVNADAANSGRFLHEALGLEGRDRIGSVSDIGGQVCAAARGGIRVLDGGRWELKWPTPPGAARCETAVATHGGVYAIAVYATPIPLLWLGLPVAAVLSGAALWGIRRLAGLRQSPWTLLRRRHLAALALVVVPAVVAAVSETSRPILLMIAPVAAAGVVLAVPPLVIVAMVFRESAERTVEIIRFRSLAAAERPTAVREWFEQNAPAYEALGFRCVGDFRLKERSEHFVRCFLSSEGDIIGEIAWARSAPWRTTRCCCFSSVTEDLRYLETGNLPLPQKEDDDRFVLQSVPAATVEETLAAHRRRLARWAEQYQTAPLCFGEQDVEKVNLFGQKQCYARLKARGLIARNPYDDVTFDFAAAQASIR